MTWTREQDVRAMEMARRLVDAKTIGKVVGHPAASVRLRLATLRERREREREREQRS